MLVFKLRIMRNRFIAVMVLASLVGSAMPLSLLTAVQAMAMPGTASHSSAKSDHSCCPDLHSRVASVVFLTLDPAAMPCGGQHPCCAKRAPENLPSLPATNRRRAPEFVVPVMIPAHKIDGAAPVRAASVGHVFDLNSLRTTVLRI